ncbi:MAG: redoxin domain-containing protein [Verrucomicrobiales bacterium]|nr:redoxin domain-containing protein [Verrucomicrobiales bacterium]MCP5558582.1 redoxin domain-containing protein [Verrucomicrobiaceae bacterium]
MKFRFLLVSFVVVGAAWADDPEPGHSLHGEAFDEGPRQRAHLMGGTGDVEFRITTTKESAQAFFNQGVGQLHGFWYYEAERSFRQVAMLDPSCAMAYWGLAMANVNNEKRAKAFLAKATERKGRAAVREQMWISTLEKFYKEDKRDKKQRALDYISDLESIVQEYPDDVEAKAFLVWKIWDAKGQVGMTSRQAVNALLDQIFAANPKHPAHHYRIHLWDDSKPALALGAAAQCGQASPGIAHMWHMPGHTFSKLRRFDDAVWQQSAATRVDHAYMIADLVLPDQIHNYAHNEEWLVRNLNELGRAADAEGLAESLIRIPRHPTWNTLDKGSCSASYGRTRLIETYLKWQQWQELIKAANGTLLGSVVQTSHETTRLRALGIAHFHLNQTDELAKAIAGLEALAKKDKAKQDTEKKAAASDPKIEVRKAVAAGKEVVAAPAKTPDKKETATEAALAELRAIQAILRKDKAAVDLLSKTKDVPTERLIRYWLRLDEKKKVEDLLPRLSQDLAGKCTKADICQALGRADEARKTFDEARKLAFAMDPTLPLAERMAALAQGYKIAGDWRAEAPKRTDVGVRPALATLGPFHWHPPAEPSWEAMDLQGQVLKNGGLEGRPRLLLFYLGHDCGHCVEQVQAFAKAAPQFQKLGVEIAAVTLEPIAVAPGIFEVAGNKGKLPMKILCDPEMVAFKKVHGYDDFEESPLHATVLVDKDNRIRWLDVSWQPFTDTKFLVDETARLLSLPPVNDE